MEAGSKHEILVERWGGEPGVANPFDVFKEVGADLVALGSDPAEVVTRLKDQMARASEVMVRSLVEQGQQDEAFMQQRREKVCYLFGVDLWGGRPAPEPASRRQTGLSEGTAGATRLVPRAVAQMQVYPRVGGGPGSCRACQ